MEFWIAVIILFVVLFCVSVYIIYDIIFSNRAKYMNDEHSLPHGEQYDAYHDVITECVNAVLEVPFEEVSITSRDGLKLYGKYYHKNDGAPIIVFFHGYRCCAIRDGNGIFLYSRKHGYNVLLVDQRAHGKSEGKTITFGVRERFDCLEWVEYLVKRFGNEQKIVLTGLSMGAATVLMAADVGLPENVKGIIADCGYSSPSGILKTVMKDLRFPVKLTYWLAKLGARIYGGFDVEEASAVEALQNTEIPILLIHGDDDRFVPCSMSTECCNVGKGEVELVLIKGAGHGMSHCVDADKYEDAVSRFWQRVL